MQNTKANDPHRLVADAEQEILDEIAEVVAADTRASNESSRETKTQAVSIALMAICLGFTWVNLSAGIASGEDAARIESDALEALELFAGDIEAYRSARGVYPRSFENPFDDPSWRYERLGDDRFRLVIAGEDGVLAYDSSEGRARRESGGGEG